MCCSANPLCGNGVVDSVEENCDDGNSNDGDSCLNVCDNRQPSGSGTNCN
jgi:cysteine-rich repeat protein